MTEATHSPAEQRVLRSLGESIRTRRKSLGRSQESVANSIGLDRTYFASVEAGRRNVAVINLCRISAGLDTTPSELLAATRWEVDHGE